MTREKVFDKHIKPVLKYVGAIGAAILMVAYVLIVVVMIVGFDPSAVGDIYTNLVFAIVNGLFGFFILQCLKIQGVSFAKAIPENQEVMAEYNGTKIKKEKKFRSMTFFWIWSVVKDFCIKVLSITLSTIGIVWIIIQGTHDWNLMLLAGVNMLTFVCWGLLALVKAYDFYNDQYINFIRQKILIIKGE